MTTAPDQPKPSNIGSAEGFAGAWRLDPDGSSVRFTSTSLWGLIRVKGRFASFRGDGSVNDEGHVSGELVIDTDSVDTGNRRRDTHLRSADFFDSATHPHIRFAANGPFQLDADRATIMGTLTVGSTSRPLEVPVEVREGDTSGMTLAAAIDIDRSLWGITWKKMGMTRMSTPVEVLARFTRAE